MVFIQWLIERFMNEFLSIIIYNTEAVKYCQEKCTLNEVVSLRSTMTFMPGDEGEPLVVTASMPSLLWGTGDVAVLNANGDVGRLRLSGLKLPVSESWKSRS